MIALTSSDLAAAGSAMGCRVGVSSSGEVGFSGAVFADEDFHEAIAAEAKVETLQVLVIADVDVLNPQMVLVVRESSQWPARRGCRRDAAGWFWCWRASLLTGHTAPSAHRLFRQCGVVQQEGEWEPGRV